MVPNKSKEKQQNKMRCQRVTRRQTKNQNHNRCGLPLYPMANESGDQDR